MRLQYCDEWGYLAIGLAACVPCWVLPLVLPNKVGLRASWLMQGFRSTDKHQACHACSTCAARALTQCQPGQTALKMLSLRSKPACDTLFDNLVVQQADAGKPWYTWFWVKVGISSGEKSCQRSYASSQQCRWQWFGSGSPQLHGFIQTWSMHAPVDALLMVLIDGGCAAPHHSCVLRLLVCVCEAQMNVWQAIFGFIGNYFWTHYFFNLLGAAYTLPSHKLNGVRTLAEVSAWLIISTAVMVSAHQYLCFCLNRAALTTLPTQPLPCTAPLA